MVLADASAQGFEDGGFGDGAGSLGGYLPLARAARERRNAIRSVAPVSSENAPDRLIPIEGDASGQGGSCQRNVERRPTA